MRRSSQNYLYFDQKKQTLPLIKFLQRSEVKTELLHL